MKASAAGARMVLAAFALFVSLSPALALSADFAEGLEAYDAGDYETVIAVWRPLAEAGNAEAQTALGALYLSGEGVAADPVLAVHWFRRAAVQGDPVAQLNLGDLHARGLGVERDQVEAYLWLSLAAAQGRRWAEWRRQELAAAMTAAELAEAQGRLEAWRPAE